MKKNIKKGFTLIELLVVIAIIGILSAIVLTQLSTARSKGADAGKKSNFRNIVNPATFYYESNSESYNGVCSYAPVQNIYTAAGATCNNAATGYRVRVQMTQSNQYSASSGTDYLCTDASGNIKILDTDPGGTAVTCP